MVGLDQKDSKPIWAVEIKCSNKFFNNVDELKRLLMFCEKNKLTDTFVTTLDKFGEREVGNGYVNYFRHRYTPLMYATTPYGIMI